MTNQPDPRRLALHEAGHVVIGHVLGLETPSDVAAYGIDWGHTRRWEPLLSRVRAMTATEWSDFVAAQGAMFLGGEAALSVNGDREPSWGADHDHAKALIAAEALDHSSPNTAYDQVEEEAEELAWTYRGAIRRFADTLAGNAGRLAGVEVEVAVQAALERRPSPRFDPESELRVALLRRELFEASSRHTDRPDQARQLWADCDTAARANTTLAEVQRPPWR